MIIKARNNEIQYASPEVISVNGWVGVVETYRGEWSNTKEYHPGDQVMHNGVLYMCVSATGPDSEFPSSNFFQARGEKGERGDTGSTHWFYTWGGTAPENLSGVTQNIMYISGMAIDDIVILRYATPNAKLQHLGFFNITAVYTNYVELTGIDFADGPQGVRGSIWRTGSGVPTILSSDEIGDYYINTQNGNVYKVIKNDSNVKIWQSQGFSVNGVDGNGIYTTTTYPLPNPTFYKPNELMLYTGESTTNIKKYDLYQRVTITGAAWSKIGNIGATVTADGLKSVLIGSDYISVDDSDTQAGKVVAALDGTMIETEGAEEDSSKLITSGAVYDDLSTKLDASKNAVSTVGGLVVPTDTPTEKELVGVGTNNQQLRVTLGNGLTLSSTNELSTTNEGTVKSVSIDGGSPEEPDNNGNVDLDIGLQTINGNITRIDGSVSSINGKIPSEATSSNQLADKNFVNSSIQNMAAFYVTIRRGEGTEQSPYTYEPFATKAELLSTNTVYINGVARKPAINDYCIVLADESKQGSLAQAPTTRYYYPIGAEDPIYHKDAWEFQYIVNNTGLTAVQVSAINSGITSTYVAQIDTNKSDITSLKTRMTTAESDISALETTVNGIPNTYAQQTGTYSGMTVGNATHATSADTAIIATSASHADSADTAVTASSATSASKATNDGNDANIAQTYATKAQVVNKSEQASKTTETVPVAIDSDGKLWVPEGGGTSDVDFEYDIPDQFDIPLLELSDDELSTDIVEDVERYNVYVDSEYIGYIDTDNVFHDERSV